MHGARTGDASGLRAVVEIERAALLATHLEAVTLRREAQRLGQEAPALLRLERVRADRLEPLERVLARDLGVVRGQWLVVALDRAQLELEPFGIGKTKRAVLTRDRHAFVAEPFRPEVERVRRRDAPDDAVHHPRPRAAAADAGILEEGKVGAGAAGLVGVEEVVDGRVVLVDRLPDESEAELARVEVDVPRRIGRDRGDVVDALELHAASLAHAAVARNCSRSRAAATSFVTTSASSSRRFSSTSSPSSSKRVGAWPNATSASTTRAPVALSALRSSACAQTAPNAPVLAPTTATGLFRSTFVASGREAQSIAFLSWPGMDALYSGVANSTASALAIASFRRATLGGRGCTS